jgi:magnesium transporter
MPVRPSRARARPHARGRTHPHTHPKPKVLAAGSGKAAPAPGAAAPPPPKAGAIVVAALVDGKVREWTDNAAVAALAPGGPADPAGAGATVWIDLTEPDPAFVDELTDALHLHPLIAEDILEGNQRGKLEVTDGLIHLVLFVLDYGADRATALEVDLVLGDGFLLSSHPVGWDPRAGARARGGLEPMLRGGADHVLWALFDTIVDSYFPFVDKLEEVIDRLQNAVLDKPDRQTLEELFDLKRDLITVRRGVSPVREILNQLTNRDLALIGSEEVIYFRDIYDHVIRLTDELDTDRELVSATVEIYLSTINNNLSTIMKRLTGVTVILAGVGAIAGVFGMSEASLAFAGGEAAGFWTVTAAIVAITVLAAVILRRIDWI